MARPANYEDRHPNDMVLHPLSEIREWDEALAVLGIQDSDQTPADAIRERDAEIERLAEALKQIAGLIDSEAGEPLDDAIRIATEALLGPVGGRQEP
jgi:hypothetical protein